MTNSTIRSTEILTISEETLLKGYKGAESAGRLRTWILACLKVPEKGKQRLQIQ